MAGEEEGYERRERMENGDEERGGEERGARIELREGIIMERRKKKRKDKSQDRRKKEDAGE